MTMHSMTGFGEATGESGRYRVAVKIRALNHRGLDLQLRLPEEHRRLEPELRRRVRRRLDRGRVEVTVELDFLGEREASFEVRRAALRGLLAAGRELAREEGLAEPSLALSDLLRHPELLTVRWRELDWTEADLAHAAGVLEEALDALEASRAREGAELRGFLVERLDRLAELAGELAARRPRVEEAIADSLRERVRALLGDLELPEERLVQEAALLVEKSDVGEELDRLGAHLASFRRQLDAEGAVGKRLDFLAQEIFRELNTIAAKARDAEMVAAVVEAKHACEQVREQLGNVE